jgi:membrane associated rhomboid family serine protease
MSSSKNKSQQPWWVDANNVANYDNDNNDDNDDNNRRRHHNNNINNNRRGSRSSSDRYLKQQQQSRTVSTTSTSTTRPTSSSTTRALSTSRASSSSSAIDNNSNQRLPEEKRERISSSTRPSSSSSSYRPPSSSSGGRKKSLSSRGEKEQITSSRKSSTDSTTIAANASTKRSTPTPLPPKRTEPKSSSSIKWTCDACTYLNIRDCPRSSSRSRTSRHDNDTTKFPTLMCEMCCTPYIPLPSTIGTTTTTTTSREQEEEEQQDPFDIERNHKITKETRQSSGGTATTARSSSISSWSPWNTTTTTDTTNNNDNDNGDTSQSTNSSAGNNTIQHYSMRELIKTLNCVDGNNANNSDVTLPPALEQRVKDFKFAQQKRREKHGDETPWGIYGLYAHLSDIRADLEWAEDAAWRRQRQKPYLSWRDFDKSRCEGGSGSGSGGSFGFLSVSNRPIFTYGVMILCTIMMFVTFGVNGWKFEPLTINPLIGPSSETLIQCGARDTALIVNEGQWFRLFTPMILHAGLIHYFVNMLALFFIGGAVEKAHGIASTAVLFIIPAVGGNILSAICLPGFISVGASGGIFGLIGGCMADICLNWNLLFLKTTMTDDNTRSRALCVLLWLAMDILINTILGFTPFVDNFTHLGGFIYGFCIGFASIERLASGFFGIRSSGNSKCSRFGSMVLRYFGLILSIIAIMVTTVILVQSDGVTTSCPGCRYISCVPFPPNSDEKWWYCDDCDIVTANLFQTDAGLYEQVNINCPNGDVEEIAVIEEGIYDLDILRRKLPSYCRSNCDEVFASN